LKRIVGQQQTQGTKAGGTAQQIATRLNLKDLEGDEPANMTPTFSKYVILLR
jgi:hypothetical protein